MIDPEKDTWRELPIGGVIPEGGTSVAYITGDWRGGGKRPVLNTAACVDCLHCWIACPDSAIRIDGGRMLGFDYNYCKGCGICARECPPLVNAIVMVEEGRFIEAL